MESTAVTTGGLVEVEIMVLVIVEAEIMVLSPARPLSQFVRVNPIFPVVEQNLPIAADEAADPAQQSVIDLAVDNVAVEDLIETVRLRGSILSSGSTAIYNCGVRRACPLDEMNSVCATPMTFLR